MSDTPRTDANYVCHYGDGLGQWVPREFSCELERELAAAQAEIAMLRKDAEYADLLRWAESHPEIAYNSITSWWAQAGRGCREREFMFSNCIKGAKSEYRQPEAAVVFNKTLTGCEIKLTGGGGGGGNT